VDEALSQLALVDERQARLVELRFFGGLEVEEVAAAMSVSVSTVEREWRAARAWLGRRIQSRGRR
jgi:DNA-directed RNA polymerase specialized sigma24 family protein